MVWWGRGGGPTEEQAPLTFTFLVDFEPEILEVSLQLGFQREMRSMDVGARKRLSES